jgi:hypothetical protein
MQLPREWHRKPPNATGSLKRGAIRQQRSLFSPDRSWLAAGILAPLSSKPHHFPR